MDVGTFLLMQSPMARPSEEVYARGVEQAVGQPGPIECGHLVAPARSRSEAGAPQARSSSSTILANSSSNCALRCSASPPTFSSVPAPSISACTQILRRDV